MAITTNYNTVFLISGGTNYYLSGQGRNQYIGSGSPWTTEAASPYRLSLNDVTPIWVPTATPATAIYGGGAPFRIGSDILYRAYDNQTEQVGIQLYANTKDNALALLRQLRRILNTARYSVPCILAITGGTNTAYYEIVNADVPESVDYLREGASTNVVFRATLTWVRTPLAGRLSSGESAFSSTTFTNTGTGANNNTQAYPTLSGDLIYEGQPLNCIFAFGASSTNARRTFFASSVLSRTYTAKGSTPSTTSTTGVLASTTTISLSSVIGQNGLRARYLARLSSISSNIQFRMIAYTGSSTSGVVLASSNWLTAEYAADLIDFGWIPLDLFQNSPVAAAGSITVGLYYRSTDGLTASASWTYDEVLFYYTFCRIDVAPTSSSASNVWIVSFTEQSGRPCLPSYPQRAFRMLGTDPDIISTPRGTPPQYFSGASLYLGWKQATAGHSTTDTASVTVTHAPLYRTLRGNG